MKYHSVTTPTWLEQGLSFKFALAPYASKIRAKTARAAASTAVTPSPAVARVKEIRKRQNKMPVVNQEGLTRPISTLRKYKK